MGTAFLWNIVWTQILKRDLEAGQGQGKRDRKGEKRCPSGISIKMGSVGAEWEPQGSTSSSIFLWGRDPEDEQGRRLMEASLWHRNEFFSMSTLDLT